MRNFRSNRQNRYDRRRLNRRQRGGVTLELLLNLPVWIICLAATIEFGLLVVNQQHLSQAARVGAEEASLIPGLPTSGNTPADVVDAVTRELRSIGILGASQSPCNVVLQHNRGGSGVTLESAEPTCTPSYAGLPAFPSSGTYVRVVVYVKMNQMTPNLLGTLGFDISGRFVRLAATYHYQSL